MAVPTIAFLTALPLEFNAVRQHLENPQSITIDGRTYTIAEKEMWRIVLRQQYNQGNYQATRETDWLIQHFQPTYLFFIGVAGGVKDVELGNIVVATFARGYESIKVKDSVTYPRLHVEYSAHDLVEQAIELARDWQVKTLVCPIASGEKLVSDQQFLEELQLHCSDAVAVEMEAIGFLGSIRQHKGCEGIVIRGISDLIVGKTAKKDKKWQPIAAQNAADFAFALLGKLLIAFFIKQKPLTQNLLHQYWDILEPELQDAFALSYNQVYREASNTIGTRHLLAALRKVGSEALRSFLEDLPKNSLPLPIENGDSSKENVLREQPFFSPCIQSSLEHIGPKALLHNRKLSDKDIFIDLAQYGTGSSVKQLRNSGIGAEQVETIIKKYGWNIIKR